MDTKAAVYPIGIVTKLTGLSQRQIRYYESMNLISPTRTKGHQRLFSPDDVDTLLAIKTLLAKGLNLQGIKSILQSETVFPEAETQVKIPELDHSLIVSKLNNDRTLVSIYPVNNQLSLQQLLIRRSQDKHRD